MKKRMWIFVAILALALCGCSKPSTDQGTDPEPSSEAAQQPAQTPNEEAAPPEASNAPAVALAEPASAPDAPKDEPEQPSEETAEVAKRKRENILSKQAPKGTENVVAWSGEDRIYVADFQNYIKRLPPAQRRDFASLEKKEEMVRNMITFYTLAQEATEAGLDKDPDVLLAMQTEMVKKLLHQRFGEGAQVEVDDPAVEARYQEQFKRYNKPARVRASHILFADKAEADKAYKALLKEIEVPGNSTRKVFREFVRKFSQDDGTREVGGDLRFFAVDGTRDGAPPLDPTLAQAAFLVQNINQVSRVIKSDQGYHILLVTNRRDEVKRSLDDVRDSIRANIAREKRERMRKEFMDQLVDFDAWSIEAPVLDAIVVESAPSSSDIKARVNSIKKKVNPNAPPKSSGN